MPDWSTLIPADWSALELILTVVGVGMLITLAVKLWPTVAKFVRVVNALTDLPAFMDRTDKAVAGIHHETHKNDGSSIKDAVQRVEEGVAGLHGRMDDVDRQVGLLARDDTKVREDLDSIDQKLDEHLEWSREQQDRLDRLEDR